jgi:hypothetical protein
MHSATMEKKWILVFVVLAYKVKCKTNFMVFEYKALSEFVL